MISVIVPVYKVERYLRKCVESIINQTYTDMEIILVDDGSPDNCGKICDELSLEDRRIKVIHQTNRGLSAARNSGLDFVLNGGSVKKENYIAFVDSDDTIDENMYQTMVDAINCGSDIAICGHRIVKEGQSLFPCAVKDNQQLTQCQLWDEMFGRLNNAVWNKVYRADLIRELRFPEGILHGEDLIFNLHYLERCRNGVINKSEFYNYLKREDSITTCGFSEKRIMEVSVKDKARELIAQYYPVQLGNADKFCFRARMNLLRDIYRSGQEKEYLIQVNEYQEYVNANYKKVWYGLRNKERLEYLLFKRFPVVYKKVARLY